MLRNSSQILLISHLCHYEMETKQIATDSTTEIIVGNTVRLRKPFALAKQNPCHARMEK